MFKNILKMSTGGSGAADLRYHVAEKRVAEEADTAVAAIRHSALATAAARGGRGRLAVSMEAERSSAGCSLLARGHYFRYTPIKRAAAMAPHSVCQESGNQEHSQHHVRRLPRHQVHPLPGGQVGINKDDTGTICHLMCTGTSPSPSGTN